ncbi:multifunctional procollagen lysine hydroxylase and glycosyltransferase LH3, partial [Tachysurus ichikawai]
MEVRFLPVYMILLLQSVTEEARAKA